MRQRRSMAWAVQCHHLCLRIAPLQRTPAAVPKEVIAVALDQQDWDRVQLTGR